MFGSGPFVSFQSNSKGAARVGGVFFFTRDGAYMIKTIKAEEAKTFLKMLPKYHKYMKRFGRKSLLTRFCGMYTVRITDDNSSDRGELQTFVVMNSVFPAEASKFISERFDLKGSTVGREVSEEELRTKGSNAVLKDLDLAREVELVKTLDTTRGPPTEYGLNIGAVAKAALLSQLRHDVKLLIDCQVMDYSLLVGVVNMDSHKYDQSAQRALSILRDQERHLQRLSKHTPKIDEMALHTLATPVRLLLSPPLFITRKLWSLARRTFSSVVTLPLPYYGAGQPTVDGGTLAVLHGTRRGDRAVYYMGLIDFLQPWTTRKVFERHWKSLIGYDIGAISCVDPEEYASRFLDFIDTHVS
jgi:1-phosphatidylinositol-4-phosphate 5-kinase